MTTNGGSDIRRYCYKYLRLLLFYRDIRQLDKNLEHSRGDNLESKRCRNSHKSSALLPLIRKLLNRLDSPL